jgi:class 3 adenylate cyclase
VSGIVHDVVGRRLHADFDYLGEHIVKNIAEPVRAYRDCSKDTGRFYPARASCKA